MGPHSPVRRWVPGESPRLLVTGLLFAGTGSLMALSPWGRRSGAHLNPVVTLAFWLPSTSPARSPVAWRRAVCSRCCASGTR